MYARVFLDGREEYRLDSRLREMIPARRCCLTTGGTTYTVNALALHEFSTYRTKIFTRSYRKEQYSGFPHAFFEKVAKTA